MDYRGPMRISVYRKRESEGKHGLEPSKGFHRLPSLTRYAKRFGTKRAEQEWLGTWRGSPDRFSS